MNRVESIEVAESGAATANSRIPMAARTRRIDIKFISPYFRLCGNVRIVARFGLLATEIIGCRKGGGR